MNPYASFLEGRDPLKIVAETPGALENISRRLSAEAWNRSLAPGKWTAREIVCHLADSEIAFGFRMRQALAEDHHVIQPFDQDGWAKTYAGYEARQALAMFSTARQWNLALLRSLPPEAFSKLLRHPERGEMTFRVIVETMAGHDVNHLRQLEAIAGERPAR